MANQRDIAEALGISQGAVSLALRGSPAVSAALVQRVRETAKRLGYRPNPYVSSLMSQIRASRKPSEAGVIALLIDHYSENDWHRHESYRVYFRGLKRRAAELGYRIECFYLREPGMSAARIDRILEARGIRGLILAPPYRGNRHLNIRWSRYACVGTGYAWEQQPFDRVAHDHDQNAFLAVGHLRDLGYARIGLVLPRFYAEGRGTRWQDGFLLAQQGLRALDRLPLFVGSPDDPASAPRFRRWLKKSRPDVLLTLYGHEESWLHELGWTVPDDLGIACLIRPAGRRFAGIDDRYADIGAATAELTASKIGFNHFGIPKHSRLLLIEGRWVGGQSVRRPLGSKSPKK